MAESCPEGLKTLWEKEKLLVTSNFTFSLSVFKRLILLTRKKKGLFGKGLNGISWVSLTNFNESAESADQDQPADLALHSLQNESMVPNDRTWVKARSPNTVGNIVAGGK